MQDLPEKSIWGIVAEPGRKTKLPFIDNSYMIISNICIGEIPENLRNNSANLVLIVKSIDMENYDESKGEAPEIISETEICTLILNTCEHFCCNHVLNPLDKAEVIAKGDFPIHISGYSVPVEGIDDDEEEEEEDKHEEEDHNEENKEDAEKMHHRIMDFIMKHSKHFI